MENKPSLKNRKNPTYQLYPINLASHIMKDFILPKEILDGIYKKARNFFWGDIENINKIHTVN